jgi:rhomboid protease GluP
MRLIDPQDIRAAAISGAYELSAAVWTGPRAALVAIYEPPADAEAAGRDLAERLDAARRWGHQRLQAQGANSCDILLVATRPIAGTIVSETDPADAVHAGAAWVDASTGAAGVLLPVPSGVPTLGELREVARAVHGGSPVPTLAAVDLAERQTVAGGYIAPVRRATITQPVVTYGFIGAFVVVYLLEQALLRTFRSPGGELFAFGALINAPGGEDWWRFVSYSFIHDNTSFLHILFNCLAMLWIGRLVEQLYGKLVLAGTFVITAAAGALLWLAIGAIAPQLSQPGTITIGASGGISGLVGLLLVMGQVQGKNVPAGVATSVRTYALIVIALNLVFGFIGGAGVGVNNFAHLGGVAAGALLGLAIPPLQRIGGRDLARWEQGLVGGAVTLGALGLVFAAANLVSILTGNALLHATG